MDRFIALIASGEAPKSILKQIHQRQQRIKDLETELAELQVQPLTQLDHKLIRKALSGKLERFSALLHEDVPRARQVLRKLLAEPMRFEPIPEEGKKSYKISGKTHLGVLLDRGHIEVASRRGFEPPT